MRRFLMLTAILAPAMALIGCGGGGLGDGPTAPGQAAPMVEGLILDVDGDSAAAGGVELVCLENGAHVVSAADGSFTFDGLPEGDVTLALQAVDSRRFSSLTAAQLSELEESEGDDVSGDGESDEAGDDSERSDRGVIVRRVRRGDTLYLRIRIDGDRIIEVQVTRPDRDDDTTPSGERELEIAMRRTDANTDPDMQGEVELSVEANGDHEFEVEVEDADVGILLETVVINPDDVEESLGFRAVELDGDAEWKLDTGDGDELPFGVDHIGRLEKHRVVVRDADGVNLLVARIPEFGPRPGDRCIRIRGRSRLLPPDSPAVRPSAGPYGLIEMRASACFVDRELDTLRQLFRVGARRLEAGVEAEVFMENPTTGFLESLGTVIADENGSIHMLFDTQDGDELPFGAGTVRVLTGLEVEVRDDVSGDVLLTGITPHLIDE